MSKWFRLGLDVTIDAYRTEFGGRLELHDTVVNWLQENCRHEFRVTQNIRKKRSPIVGYTEPRIFLDVTFRRKEDASMFKLFFHEKITTSCRCPAP